MNLEPLDNRIIIKRINLETKSKGGIILGNEVDADRDTGYGRVLFIGVNASHLVKEGEIVAFNDRMPIKITYKGERFFTLRTSDVFFIVRDEDVQEKEYQSEGADFIKNGTPLN